MPDKSLILPRLIQTALRGLLLVGIHGISKKSGQAGKRRLWLASRTLVPASTTRRPAMSAPPLTRCVSSGE